VLTLEGFFADPGGERSARATSRAEVRDAAGARALGREVGAALLHAVRG